ncbi:hypothetical protein [uncultured Azohydromonas sp.]|uniref:hypothetical protein n=1 Tax=uncultured Azohydromonas sp. TaxID=487342 RepID=UPI002628D59E|nr:hypothetical protein [uncultured Azohydromonas sp.]
METTAGAASGALGDGAGAEAQPASAIATQQPAASPDIPAQGLAPKSCIGFSGVLSSSQRVAMSKLSPAKEFEKSKQAGCLGSIANLCCVVVRRWSLQGK